MRRRDVAVLVLLAVLGTSVVVGVLGLGSGATADAAHVARLVARSVEQRAPNAVSGVLFDLRAIDTLGEALALFAAAAGLQVALRELGGEGRTDELRTGREDRDFPPTSDAVRAAAVATVPVLCGLAVLVTVRGHLTVGGGLQGGALAVAVLAVVLLAGGYRTQRELAPDDELDLEEAVGAGGYVLVGLLGSVVAGSFLANVLPLGDVGALLSGGTILVLGVLVAVEARAALGLIAAQLVEEPLEREGAP